MSSVLKRSPLLWTIWHTLEVLFLQRTFEEANWSRSKYGWYLHDEAFLSRILTQKLTKLTLSPSLRFNDSAKNKMIQVNNNLNFPLQSSSRRSCRCRDKIHDLLFQFFLIYSKKHFHFFYQLLFLIWWFTSHSFPFQPIFQSDSVHFVQLKWEIH